MAVFLLMSAVALSRSIEYSAPAKEAGTAAESASGASYEEDGAYSGMNFVRPHSLLKDLGTDDGEDFTPGPETLNMAYLYDDDADISDAINSYAGRVYQQITGLNSSLFASFYDYTDVSPASVAEGMGLGAERVMGGYNPEDSSHDPYDPSTWTVNSFRNVTVSFYDGDGNSISGYYAAQEILSLASVYMYYHDNYCYADFLDYCKKLFNSAITYKVSLGDVYYDQGCLSRTVFDEAAEAMALEEGYDVEDYVKGSSSPGYSAGEAPESYADPDQEAEGSLADYEETSEAYEETRSVISDTPVLAGEETTASTRTIINLENRSTGEETTEETSEAVYYRGGGEAPQAGASDETPGVIVETLPSEEETETETANSVTYTGVLGESYYSREYYLAEEGDSEETGSLVSETPENIYYVESVPSEEESSTAVIGSGKPGGVIYDDSIYQTAESTEAESVSIYNSSINEAPKALLDNEGNVVYTDTIEDFEEKWYSRTFDMASLTEEDEEEDDILTERINALLDAAEIDQDAESYCPGHIDIYITVTIRGIDDQANSLFDADKAGWDEANFTESWQGWTDEMKAHARKLNGRDWFEDFGISISSIDLSSELTTEEIESYLAMLPEGTGTLRTDIIRFALNSVGRIPYYWGGKPRAAGYEGNDFYKLVSPDIRGRILKGLDCSGWINWVYWSVTGESLPGNSTAGLVGCGRKILRSELKPGDIIIRVGEDPHVVMFLCWTKDGSFIGIHETGGIVNNVAVAEMTANWPYYRSIAD